jgi:hypothetical protein
VWKGQPLGLDLEVAEQQQVEVDGARTVAGPGEGATVLDLDRLAEVEQLPGIERRPDPGGGVEEVGLVEDLADRLGLIQRGDGLDRDPVIGEVSDGAPQMRFAVPDVRAEADVTDPLAGARGLAQTPSPSSSGSRSAVPSSVTSTATSSTG